MRQNFQSKNRYLYTLKKRKKNKAYVTYFPDYIYAIHANFIPLTLVISLLFAYLLIIIMNKQTGYLNPRVLISVKP